MSTPTSIGGRATVKAARLMHTHTLLPVQPIATLCPLTPGSYVRTALAGTTQPMISNGMLVYVGGAEPSS